MKTTKVSFVIVAFLVGVMCFTSCKSVRMSFLGVFHFQKQFETGSKTLPVQDSVMVIKDGFYKGSGGPGRILGFIQSSDSMLVNRAQISLRRIGSENLKPEWSFFNSSEKGFFNIIELPCAVYDISFVNIDSELIIIRNVVLSDSVPEAKLNIVLNHLK